MRLSNLALGFSLGTLAFGGCQLIVDPQPEDMGGSDGDAAGGDDSATDPSTDPCAAVRCRSGTHCEASEKGVQCVPDEPALTCASVLCIEGTVCVETADGPECVPNEEHPCNLVDCQPNHVCTLENGEAACVPAGQPCGDVTCGAGLECCNASCGICVEPGLSCIQVACDDDVPPSCATVQCPANTSCLEASEGATCEPLPDCTNFLCDEGQHCEMIVPPCLPPPEGTSVADDCSPFPECVADLPEDPPSTCALVLCKEGTYCDASSGVAQCLPIDVCAGVRCQKGHHCEAVEVQCFQPPCPPVAECVPKDDGGGKGEPCGRKTCGEGEVCCNESCGICTPPGGGCIDLFCGAND